MGISAINGCIVRLLVPSDTVLAEGTKVKQVSFKLDMYSDGLTMVSPLIYYFITSDDADYATDIAPQIEELDAESMLDFAAFGFGHNSKR